MNELFLSGTILNLVKTPTTGDTSHVVCQLRHSHRNRHAPLVGEPLAKPFTLRGLPKPPLLGEVASRQR